MTEQSGLEEVDYPDLPKGWEWSSGSTSESYYTLYFQTAYQMGGKLAGKDGLGGYEGEVFWDKGGDHWIQIRPITSIGGDGDPVHGYEVVSKSFESKQEAVNAVPELIEGL